MSINDFLYPHQRPHTGAAPDVQAFEAHLETFAQQVSYVCNLEAGGKLSPDDAYARLEQFWQHLQQAKTASDLNQPVLG